MALTHALSTNNYGPAKFIVATSAANGSHTTLTSAMADAVSGDTIFLRDSVTENVTLTAGVNIAAWTGGSLNTPSVTGTLTMTAAGTCNISGIRLVTNSAALLAVTGTAASIVNLNNCYLNCSNNTGITFSTSDATAQININNSIMDLGTTGIAYFSDSSAGTLNFQYCQLFNTGSSLTASTKSAGKLTIGHSLIQAAVTYSSSNAVSTFLFSNAALGGINTTFLTTSGTGTLTMGQCFVSSGSASGISIGSGTTVQISESTINSSNTNAITGAGSIQYSAISFSGTSTTINTTTQTVSGTLQGSKNTAPTAGMLGEQLRSAVASPGVSVLNNTGTNITNISLTAGIWDVSGIFQFAAASGTTCTNYSYSLNSTSATLGTAGDNSFSLLVAGAVTSYSPAFAIPAWRVTLSSTTTIYLVVAATIAVSTMTAYGRISATRVG